MTEPTCATTTRVRLATDADADRWNSFVNLCPRANFYQRYEWATVNRDGLGHRLHFLIGERGTDVVGVLPLVRVRSRLFGDVLASMPFVNYGGPAGVDDEAESALVQAACAEADRIRCDYLEIRAMQAFGALPTTTEKVSMAIQLDADPEALFRSFSQKHRHNIRRVLKNGIDVRAGGPELLADFYQILSRSWQRLGTPLFAPAYFADIVQRFGDGVRIFVAYADGAPIAAAFNGQFRGVVEGLWAGVDDRAQALQPNYALYWGMIRDACERGFSLYHLGRSTKDSGAMQFKAKWSAHPQQLHWNYHLVRTREIPRLNPRNPKYRLAINTWRRLPLGVLGVVGPRLARLIP